MKDERYLIVVVWKDGQTETKRVDRAGLKRELRTLEVVPGPDCVDTIIQFSFTRIY